MAYDPSTIGYPANVKAFGAAGDGTTNDTSAIASAVAAVNAQGGGVVYFPPGRYVITSEIGTPGGSITFQGANMYASIIQQNTLTANGFNLSKANCAVRDLGISYPSQATAGNGILAGTGTPGAVSRTAVNNVNIVNAFNCINSNAENTSAYSNVFFSTFTGTGFWFQQTANVTLTSFSFTGSATLNPASGIGIYLQGNTQGCEISFGESFQSNRTLLIGAVSSVKPEFNKFIGVYFDSGTIDAVLDNGAETSFTDCWFSNGRSGGGFPGLSINTGDNNRFVNTQFANCGGSGVVLNGGINTAFATCSFFENSTTASGVKSGLEIAANVSGFSAIGCTAGNLTDVLAGSTQAFGILVNAGTSDNYQLIGNNFSGNTIAPISDGGTGANKYVYGNIGYRTSNNGSTGVTAGNTSVTVTHGLSATPTQASISVTALTDSGSGSRFFVDNVTSTTFRINLQPSNAFTQFFAWQARVSGA